MDVNKSMEIFGENLRIYRAKNNLSQIDFANMIGIQHSTLSGYENGTRFPSTKIAILIADTMNVSLDYLFGVDKRYDGIKDTILHFVDALKNYGDTFYYSDKGCIELYDPNIKALFGRIQKLLNVYNEELLDDEIFEDCIEKAISESVDNIKKEWNSI